jgi:hypothetical protein
MVFLWPISKPLSLLNHPCHSERSKDSHYLSRVCKVSLSGIIQSLRSLRMTQSKAFKLIIYQVDSRGILLLTPLGGDYSECERPTFRS